MKKSVEKDPHIDYALSDNRQQYKFTLYDPSIYDINYKANQELPKEETPEKPEHKNNFGIKDYLNRSGDVGIRYGNLWEDNVRKK